MNRLFSFLIVACMSLSTYAQNQGSIQIAILFDTSNSMDGLIDQAKSRIWSIVNTTANLRYQGQIPQLEIALYEYGNDNIPATSNHVRMILPFTSDLDVVSQKLFALTTRGGSEYCGAVISNSVYELQWKTYSNSLKQIYIAGNEPFNQGTIDYKGICRKAGELGIQVNAIYCGEYQQGINEFWYDGAQIGKGEYSNINSNLQVKNYTTPYDQQIRAYNDSLNRTYIGYGSAGISKKAAQSKEDMNAASQSDEVMTERAIVKSKKIYKNESWDLIDAVERDSTTLAKITDKELPEDLKGKSKEEVKKHIEVQKKEREKFQKAIGELSVEREKFITEAKKVEKDTTKDLGAEINKNVIKHATAKGFEVEK